jgi:predicted Zn-dependent protease
LAPATTQNLDIKGKDDTFESHSHVITTHIQTEAQLRLLNGLYPRGEPRIGDWVKVIQ